MPAEALTPVFDPAWEVPEGRYVRLKPRAAKYSVVVPVINEGKNIRKQLDRMAEAGVMSMADVIIADGGSSDGSLEEGMLEGLDIHALIVKTGPGRLGAQLRMGYAYSLTEGHDGIITIDGNNKDSVESVALFVRALDEGYDYAQGSRYMKGGCAINTPLVRYLASRFIHAPVISIAAHCRLTDTTNGFRSYSRRYLLHPEVQPFRKVFTDYELLAYLSARASRLGLRVTEVPVTRAYPATGPTPTKISAISGNLSLLRVLRDLLLGRYNPPASRP